MCVHEVGASQLLNRVNVFRVPPCDRGGVFGVPPCDRGGVFGVPPCDRGGVFGVPPCDRGGVFWVPPCDRGGVFWVPPCDRGVFCLVLQLKRQFTTLSFPPLPGRWPFKMSDVAIDGRRRKLQEYLEKGAAHKWCGSEAEWNCFTATSFAACMRYSLVPQMSFHRVLRVAERVELLNEGSVLCEREATFVG